MFKVIILCDSSFESYLLMRNFEPAAIMENLAFPFSACGSLIAHKIITKLNWRWIYYISIIINGVALVTIVLLYHAVGNYN